MKTKGFSLIELLIVVSIIVTIFSLGIASFNRFNRRERLKQAGLTLKSTLRYAQTKAISADKPKSGCTTYTGIHMTFTQYSYTAEHYCNPEGSAGTVSTVSFAQTGISFSSVPDTFTFLQTSGLDIAPAPIILTNGLETYELVLSQSGTVSDHGF